MSRACNPPRDPASDAESSQQNPGSAILLDWERTILRAASVAGSGLVMLDRNDLAQEARIRVWRATRSAPPRSASYMRTVIANALRSAIHKEGMIGGGRRSGEHTPLSPVFRPVPLPSGFDRLADRDEPTDWLAVSTVQAILRKLPRTLRTVYRLLYVDGWSQREAANVLRVSQPRIAQLHHELLERTRAAICQAAAA